MSPRLAILLASLGATAATAAPLKAVVSTVDEPEIRIARLDSGATPQARYASADTSSPPNVPLVLLVHVPASLPPDDVQVTKAERDGTQVKIAIQRRRFTGTYTRTLTLPATGSFVEVDLGALAAGEYRAVIEYTDLSYVDQNQPQKVAKTTTSRESFGFFVRAPSPTVPTRK